LNKAQEGGAEEG